ncbi:hypothetical protein ABTB21_11200 [Acinetobacter baumannii]
MSNLFRYIALFFLFLQVGCSNGVYEQPADKYPFEVKMKALLGDNIEIIDSINKYEAQVSYFELALLHKAFDGRVFLSC